MTKKILLMLVTGLALLSSSAYASSFCDGFKRGYVVGYKQANNTAFYPYVPHCPYMPFRNYSDPKSDYEFGYLVGIRKGMISR